MVNCWNPGKRFDYTRWIYSGNKKYDRLDEATNSLNSGTGFELKDTRFHETVRISRSKTLK